MDSLSLLTAFIAVGMTGVTTDAPPTLAGRDFLTTPGAEWKLAWHDEFEGATLDTANWSVGLPWTGDGMARTGIITASMRA